MKRHISTVLVLVLGVSAIALSGGCSKNEAASAKCQASGESTCMACCKANGATGTRTTKINNVFSCGCGGVAK